MGVVTPPVQVRTVHVQQVAGKRSIYKGMLKTYSSTLSSVCISIEQSTVVSDIFYVSMEFVGRGWSWAIIAAPTCNNRNRTLLTLALALPGE